jgi:hypothetical protein
MIETSKQIQYSVLFSVVLGDRITLYVIMLQVPAIYYLNSDVLRLYACSENRVYSR